MDDIKIREACIRDIPRILEMVRFSFPEEIGIFGLDFRNLLAIYGLFWALQRLRRRPFFQFFVAERAGTAVAGAMMDLYEDYAYVSAVMVHPEHRQQGVGKTLLSQALAEVFRLGAKRAVLHVREDNLPARNLYRSLGFQAFEERIVFFREASDPPAESAFPPEVQVLARAPWDARVLAVRRASQEPAARAVYGPLQAPRGLRRLFASKEKALLLFERGTPAGVATVRSTGKTAVISVGLVPWADKKELAWALLIQALRKGQRTILRTTAKSTSVIEAAKDLGFRQVYRELGLVLERRS